VLEIQVKLAAMWGALMLSYLLGDVLHIYSGDAIPGNVFGELDGHGLWLGIAIVMLVPVLMVLDRLVPVQRDRAAVVPRAVRQVPQRRRAGDKRSHGLVRLDLIGVGVGRRRRSVAWRARRASGAQEQQRPASRLSQVASMSLGSVDPGRGSRSPCGCVAALMPTCHDTPDRHGCRVPVH
jgi:hypothetical protein